MNTKEILRMYRQLAWRDFYGRAVRRIFDFAIPQTSYAQAGEDMVVDFLFQGVGVQPLYLELGANHPKAGNNTYKFYRRGCHGVLVEADPSLIQAIRSARKRDTVLNVGVGLDDSPSKKFFIFECSGINTFDEKEAMDRDQNSSTKIKAVIDVPMMTVNKIISEYLPRMPDFLSIDIEGLDLAVLKTLDFDLYPIPVICAETCLFSETHIKGKDQEIEKFLATKGYFVYADTYVNTIFVNKNWFFKMGI
jgi:FkbM family methyltransferase